MARKRGGMGPGSLPMGGPGKKPTPAPTPFARGGRTSSGPGAGSSMPIPSVGGRGAPSSGLPPAAAPVGMKKGGEAVKKHERGGEVSKEEIRHHHVETAKHHAKEAMETRPGKKEREERKEREEHKQEHNKYARGGPVEGHARIAGHTTHGMAGRIHPAEEGISKGADKKRSAGPHGADSRVHRPHSGKAS